MCNLFFFLTNCLISPYFNVVGSDKYGGHPFHKKRNQKSNCLLNTPLFLLNVSSHTKAAQFQINTLFQASYPAILMRDSRFLFFDTTHSNIFFYFCECSPFPVTFAVLLLSSTRIFPLFPLFLNLGDIICFRHPGFILFAC